MNNVPMRKLKLNRTLIKLLMFVPYLIILYVLQAMLLPHVKLFGVKPLILPLAVSGVALFGGHVAGCGMGLCAGILCDLAFNQPTAEFTIILTITGFILGVLSDVVLVQSYPSYFLCSLCALVICGVCEIFPIAFFQEVPVYPLLRTVLYQTLYSMFYTVPFYYISKFVCRVI